MSRVNATGAGERERERRGWPFQEVCTRQRYWRGYDGSEGLGGFTVVGAVI